MNYAQLLAEIQSYTQNTFSTADINTFIEQAEQRIYNEIQFPSLRKNVTGTLTSANQYLSCPLDYLSTYSLAVIDGSGNYTYLLNKDVNFIREAYPGPTTQGLPLYYAIFGPQYALINELSLILGPTPDQNYNVELHYFFYPPSIVSGQISILGPSFSAGTAYTNGTFYNATLTGGSGVDATAIITVASGVVTSAVLQSAGSGYVVGDNLSYASPIGSGSGFLITVNAVNNATGHTWLGDNFDTTLLYGSLVEAYTFMKGEGDMLQLYEARYKEAVASAKRLGDGLERQDAYRSGQYRQQVI